ncbi:MAG: hypothetical protein WBD60_10685, partial [Methylovirgula sp.]
AGAIVDAAGAIGAAAGAVGEGAGVCARAPVPEDKAPAAMRPPQRTAANRKRFPLLFSAEATTAWNDGIKLIFFS